MPRTVIHFPAHVDFVTDHTVVVGDINAADHLGVDRLFAIVFEAQLRFVSSLGYPNPRTIDGVGYIMADTESVYRAESKRGDVLQIEVSVDNLHSKGFELLYRVYNKTRSLEAALIKTGMLGFDYDKGCVAALPDSFFRRFSRA